MKRILCLWFPNWPVQRRLNAPSPPAPLPKWERGENRLAPLSLHGRGAGGEGVPLILHAPVAGKQRVIACSRAARKLGVKVGMLLAEAEALCLGQGTFEPHDPRADREGLQQLARWCQQFTPLAAVEQAEMPDSLLLDVTGCGFGFGGLEGLAKAAIAGLGRERRIYHEDTKARREEKTISSLSFVPSCLRGKWNFFAFAAIADTVGAAWALAHHGAGERVRVIPPGEHEAALRPLPIAALRLPAETIDLLRQFDLHRIEQLLDLPRGELPCRFGPVLLERLDQALGHVREPIEPEPQDDPIHASWPFEPPIADARLLDQAIGYLLERVLEQLQPRRLGVSRMLCSLTLASGEPVRIPVGLVRPSATFAHLIDLLRLHLERVRVTAEIAEVALDVLIAVPLEFQQDEMFEEALGTKSLVPLVERLSSRLGDEAVVHPQLEADAQPEYGWRKNTLTPIPSPAKPGEGRRGFSPLSRLCGRGDGGEGSYPALRSAASASRLNIFRPPRLERRPVAVDVMSVVPNGPPLSFEWKGRSFRIVHAWGPERIETGWWRGDDVKRDYYQVETAAGERYWLFRRLPDERWFLHGAFS